MLTLLHTVYSKIRMEAWGCYAAFEEPRRYKKCKSHDGQSWHSNCKRIYILSMTPDKNRKGCFLECLKKKLTKTSFPHWPTTKYWIPPPFLFPPLRFQKSFPPLTFLFEIVVPFFTEQGEEGEEKTMPSVPGVPLLYPLKTSGNLTVFWFFQWLEKGCIGNEWVKRIVRILLIKPNSPTFLKWKIDHKVLCWSCWSKKK